MKSKKIAKKRAIQHARVCEKVRGMYVAIYDEDVKRGGVTADQYKEAHPEYRLMNRPSGPWVWGHDMSDLVIEGLVLTWKTSTHCHIYPLVGS